MKIHNVMEETVLAKVREIFEDEAGPGPGSFCTCPQCELDVACYVLNQMPPKYILSGRGLAHYEIDYLKRVQTEADLAAQIRMAIDAVSQAKRPHFDHDLREFEPVPKGDFFNIPTLSGRVFNSANFEPVADIDVSLLFDGELSQMISPNWQNPQTVAANTPGAFNFWTLPFPADKANDERTFEFEIAIDDSKFEPLRHYFEVSVAPEDAYIDYYRLSRSFQIKDIYLLPRQISEAGQTSG